LRIFHNLRLATFGMLLVLVGALSSLFRARAALQLENLALRHQIGVLQRSVKKRPTLTAADRILWAWLCTIWSDWRSALVIVKLETVITWHRKGFRLFWTWKIRHGQVGRPAVPKEVRDLIRKMSRDNPLWGAPRIHGELLKLGIDIGQTSVGKYMVRHRKPPSQTWRRVLANASVSPGNAGWILLNAVVFTNLPHLPVKSAYRRSGGNPEGCPWSSAPGYPPKVVMSAQPAGQRERPALAAPLAL